MQEGVEKNLDFLVCFCNIIYPLSKKNITPGNSEKWCYSYTLCDMGHTPIYYQCNAPMIVICGSSQFGGFTKIIFLVVTLHVINIPLGNGQLAALTKFCKAPFSELTSIFMCVTHSSTFSISSPRETV